MAGQHSKESVSTSSLGAGTIYPRQRIIQNLLLLWLDTGMDESNKDYQDSLAQLRSAANKINIFTDQDEAIDFLTEDHGVKAFLIVEGSIGQHILPLIHDIPQLDTIYIFGSNQSQHQQWTQKWNKINGVHMEVKALCKAVQLAAKQYNQDSIAVSFVTVGEDSPDINLNQLEPTFMYTQIFKEILLNMEYDQQSVKNFTTYCREGDHGTSDAINRFENGYSKTLAVWWYTVSSFIYPMLNAALRLMESETIISMGFFIHDLHNQIQQLHRQQFDTSRGRSFTVYRGQGLAIEDFEKLQKTKGRLMSFNNFLSTSIDRDISLVFAESASTAANKIGILFEISIDPSISSTPFASIAEFSQFKEEREILFSMHTVFRVVEITELRPGNSLFQVDLQLTPDDDQELRILTEHIRKEVGTGTGWQRLSTLLMKIGHFNKAEELCNVLLDQSFGQDKEAIHYNNLGFIKHEQGDHKKAIECYEKALEIFQKTLAANHPMLATSYNNIAGVYYNMGEYSTALSFFEKALEIQKKTLPTNHPDFATLYNNIGIVYEKTREYSKALSFFEKAFEIQKKTLPANHPSLANSYNNIGMMYHNMREYSKALSFFEKALEIRQKTLPVNHPDLAASYNNIGIVYYNMDEYSKALSFYEKALEIQKKTLPANHPDLAGSYNNIAAVSHYMGEYSKALLFLEKALEIQKKTLPANHLSLATSYNSFGMVYRNMGECSKALSFFEKALEIQKKTLPRNHPDLDTSYNNLGMVYYNMREYSKALSYLERAHQILQSSLPANHPDIENVRNGINFLKASYNLRYGK